MITRCITLGRSLVPVATVAGLGSYCFIACDGDNSTPLEPSLSKKEFRSFKVLERERLSADSSRIRIALPSPEHTLGLEVASCVSFGADIEGEAVSRPYTPISTREQKGYADFAVKAYPARTDGKPGGMGRHLNSLGAGDEVRLKGPWKGLSYVANEHTHMGFVAGGSGLTPCLQVIQEVLGNPADKTHVTLLFANRSEDDILLRPMLDALAARFPEQFTLVYTVDKAAAGWQGEVGFVSAAMARKVLPPPSDTTMVVVCGPPPMIKAVAGPKDGRKQGEIAGVLGEVGYTKVYKY